MIDMSISSGWYTSGTFWAAAGVVVALLAAAVATWAAFAVGFPRRRLYYGTRAAAPLLRAPEGMQGDLRLYHRGTLLTDPHVLTIELATNGTLDIPSDMYDGGKPLMLDVGAKIIEILKITSSPETIPVPLITADNSVINIGPSLIGKRHAITIAVLTDGGYSTLTCKSPLVNVRIGRRGYDVPPPAWRRWIYPIGIVIAIILWFLLPSHG